MVSAATREAGLSPRFYRFRSVDSLIGKRAELAGQYVYFADPATLNDPLEGFRDIVWNGDPTAWRNHIRHYLLCLMQTVSMLHIMGPAYNAVQEHDFTSITAAKLPTDQFRALFETISRAFFSDARLAAYPQSLAARGPMRRDELLFYLWTLHPHAVRAVTKAFADHRLCPPDQGDVFKDWGSDPLDGTDFEGLRDGVISAPDADKAGELFAVARMAIEYRLILAGGEPDPATAGWGALLGDFPSIYLDRLQTLMHPPWYTACFVTDYRQAAMWGHYGDSHRGVCLEFASVPDGAGEPALPLKQEVGFRASGGKSEPIIDTVRQRFHPVRYESGAYAEVDFFSSLGCLAAPDLAFWFLAEDGQRSAAAGGLFEAGDDWRKTYWSRHYDALTTKRDGWAHEKEHRLVLTASLLDFREVEARKLAFDLDSLTGVIFGLRTPATAKREIMRIVREKCEAKGRADFDFYQAYYSRGSGQIERAKLPFRDRTRTADEAP